MNAVHIRGHPKRHFAATSAKKKAKKAGKKTAA